MMSFKLGVQVPRAFCDKTCNRPALFVNILPMLKPIFMAAGNMHVITKPPVQLRHRRQLTKYEDNHANSTSRVILCHLLPYSLKR